MSASYSNPTYFTFQSSKLPIFDWMRSVDRPVTLKVTLFDGDDRTPSTLLVAEHSTLSVRPTQSSGTTSDLQPTPDRVWIFLTRVGGPRVMSGAGLPRAVQRSSSPADSDDFGGLNRTSLAPSICKQRHSNESRGRLALCFNSMFAPELTNK